MPFTAETSLLQDQVILVTGAAGGIGSEVAKSYARQGATVVLLDKQLPTLEQVYDAIVDDGSPQPALYPFDLKGATNRDYQQLVERITDNFGRLDGLVHCAAVLGQLAPAVHQDLKTWGETLHVNLTAAFLLTQACLPLLQQTKTQSFIVFTTDSNQNKAYWGAYGISKAGLENLCQQLAKELEAENKVRVCCLDPGQTRTALHARAYPAKDPNQLPEPAAVVPAYLYLASPHSMHLNGQCVNALSIL
ncbi:MAG TPA: SDR family NAD(P)-dependent oxidoreductase [Methylophaga sp.]|nr:SDR family NAD(P)-dependent oxidoreductase [Methylophaga sp.]